MKKRISLGAEKTNHSDVRPEELSFEEREDESALLSVEARRERGTMPEVAPDMEEASTDSSYNGNGNGNGKGKGKGKGNSTDGPGNDSSGGNKVGNLFETFMSTQQFQNSLKSLFQRKRPSIGDESDSPRPLPFLSQLANSVVSRCARNLKTSTEELQQRFDSELPESVRTPLAYARNFLEFCSLETLHVLTRNPNYLGDKEFRQLTFDMMLAWEAPGSEVESLEKEASSSQEAVDGDGGSLFYSSSTNMAVQVDDKKTVGRDAFAQIAPACAAIADAITVYNLFDVLTGSSSQRLHFIMYDKYLRNLDRVIKAAKSALGPPLPNLQLADGEIILDVDGTVPTHPVLQHIGITAWPGRLTLTTKALYFESLGVGVYDKAVRYDLATDMKQVIKPELTGPLGARIFDKAVMYKSVSVTEPVYMEFPEFKGNSRRDYWLDICLEILRAHKFARKYNFKEIQQAEIIARAILGIFRCRAIREGFNIFSSQYKTLLAFNLVESLPGGDIILETLYSRLLLIDGGTLVNDGTGSPYTKQMKKLPPVALITLRRLGFTLLKQVDLGDEAVAVDVCVGDTNPFDKAVKKSILDTGRVEAAQASIDQVKVEGIDTNMAVMKELLFPVLQLAHHLQVSASWEHPFKSTVFLALVCLMIYRGWIRYVVPSIFVFFAVTMLWRRHFYKGKSVEAYKIIAPPNRNPVEQLLTLQDAIGQVESLIQAGNIILLKIRALLFAVLPQGQQFGF
ncbi:uncharacterized protein LOC116197739 isoform X2 [Punica granatum]|uniref:Uncharacterized protein LOC116197739 isoform X2 n=1 Tax=Punica granatum TaxID=22663 RepID=A0A6P8CKG8_PUNGR|nr:uncharacterized protein LOC116197739 isoform X2 [Punica granatum]